jgi:Tfp pilus assembly major pilin PilA
MRNERAGLTLIELLLIAVILGILAAIGVPAFFNYVELSAAYRNARAACNETIAFLKENTPRAVDGVTMTLDGERLVQHGNETVTAANPEPLTVPGKGTLKHGDSCRVYVDSGIEVIGEESGQTLLRVLDAAATRTHLLTGMVQACPPGILYYRNTREVSFLIRRYDKRLDELRSLPCAQGVDSNSGAIPPTRADAELQRTKRLLQEYENRPR